MIHPSYRELMDKINEENTQEGLPEVTSRYMIVLASSKRARQLTNGAEPMAYAKSGKPLSIAVEELYEGKVKILGTVDPEDEEETAQDEAVIEDTAAADDSEIEAAVSEEE